MRIYTRSGDGGDTDLLGGGRVRKDEPRIEAVGAVDALNAALGWCRAQPMAGDHEALLAAVQSDLFVVGADLAAPSDGPRAVPRLSQEAVVRLERHADALEAGLPPLRNFILPGGSPAGAALHVARTETRTAERRVVALAAQSAVNPQIIAYLNRLSDLLFLLARRCNADAGRPDTTWTPG